MDERDLLANRFEEHRPRLRAVAYRMLGSPSEAEDAVQEAWLRLDRSDSGGVENLGGWLTTVVGRVCLNMLRSRGSRRERFLEEPWGETSDARMPDPIVGRSPAASRQLASRARRRVRGEATLPAADPARQREVVDAFLAASRDGDLEALLTVLDPDVVLRADPGAAGASREVRGAHAVAEQARAFSHLGQFSRRALVNGVAGIVSRAPGGPTFSVMGFTVVRGKITEIDILADPERLRLLDLAFLDD